MNIKDKIKDNLINWDMTVYGKKMTKKEKNVKHPNIPATKEQFIWYNKGFEKGAISREIEILSGISSGLIKIHIKGKEVDFEGKDIGFFIQEESGIKDIRFNRSNS